MLDPILRQARADLRHAKVLVDRAERARAKKEAEVDHYRSYQSQESVLAGTAAPIPGARQQSRKARKARQASGEPLAGDPG